MTPAMQSEFDYRVTERLAILGAGNPPTREQKEIAEKEARESLKQLWPITFATETNG